jgi:hypothetical protein
MDGSARHAVGQARFVRPGEMQVLETALHQFLSFAF